jgi:hypothetical protein
MYTSYCPRHSAGKQISSGALLLNPLKLLTSKKSQFYLLTALVLIGYSTLLLQSFNVVPDSSQNFRKVYDNYVFESSVAINNALFAQADVGAENERFMDRFIAYSRMKKLDVEIFSILAVGDRVYFSNRMQNTVRIIELNETIPTGSDTYFLRGGLSEVAVEVRDDIFHENIYKFSISDKGTEAKAILRVRKGANRQIFVKD